MDDETIGAGGSLLRFAKQGDEIHWLNIANTRVEYGYADYLVAARIRQRDEVKRAFGFSSVADLELRPAHLDEYDESEMISRISDVMSAVKPNILIVPFPGDVHSDHGRVFSWLKPFTKSFRNDSVKTVLAMEVLSETDFAIGGDSFAPDYYIDITGYLDAKIEIAKLYAGEVPESNFPRSAEAIRAQALLRGSVAGVRHAEAFKLLRHIEK
jgi:LmbE family N-acetylglucosaminyl deacetylase